jgi:hypothetical protein
MLGVVKNTLTLKTHTKSVVYVHKNEGFLSKISGEGS